MSMNYWIAVANREHVLKGQQENIMQVCHGKQNPLKRMKSGDWIIYYSPTEIFGSKELCRKFTAIGQITNQEPYQYKMSDDFIPWRRDVVFCKVKEVEIKPLIDKLSFIKNKKQWGFIFRYGLFSIPYEDFIVIASTMGIIIHEEI
jgi:predicted RNA-binding protein